MFSKQKRNKVGRLHSPRQKKIFGFTVRSNKKNGYNSDAQLLSNKRTKLYHGTKILGVTDSSVVQLYQIP
jgi:hypothetical protein